MDYYERSVGSGGSSGSEQRLAGVRGDGFAGGIAEADNFLPGSLGVGGVGVWGEERADGDGDRGVAGEPGFVAEEEAGVPDGDGANGSVSFGGGFEGAELEGADARERSEGAFGEDGDGVVVEKSVADRIGLADAGLGIAAVEGEVCGASDEGADDGHVEGFAFSDEASAGGEHGDEENDVGVGGVVSGEDPG